MTLMTPMTATRQKMIHSGKADDVVATHMPKRTTTFLVRRAALRLAKGYPMATIFWFAYILDAIRTNDSDSAPALIPYVSFFGLCE